MINAVSGGKILLPRLPERNKFLSKFSLLKRWMRANSYLLGRRWGELACLFPIHVRPVILYCLLCFEDFRRPLWFSGVNPSELT